MEKVDSHFFSKKLESLQESSRRRTEEEKLEKERQREFNELNNLIQLPLWPEEARGVPNCVLRGSLFAAIPARNAKHCKRVTLHESDKLKLVFTGERLTQSDFDVWQYALHLARKQCLGNKVHITERSFLKGLDRGIGKANHEWLKDVFAKLGGSWVEITCDSQTYCGSLLDEAYRDEKTGEFVLVLNSKISRLFEAGNTWISWEERKIIGNKKSLALWLHGYIATHVKWYPHKIETIKKLSGSETKQLKHFKSNLIEALKHLRELKLIEEFRVDDKSLVHITRTPSSSQQKHLDSK